MLLLPLDRPIDWRKPPVVTLILVLINVLIFFTWQHNDGEYQEQAERHYIESGLLKTELGKYYEYQGQAHKISGLDIRRVSRELRADRQRMQSDAKFQHKLARDEIIRPQDSDYSNWKQNRRHYDALQDQVTSYKYAINPASPSVLTYFTSMFLHADTEHLIGNMIFLLLIGYVVETILGYGIYLLGYLFAGLAGNALYVILMADQFGYGIGASGAIYGVLGMYLVLFALRKIRFFLFLFVYFHYFRAPALIMLIPIAGWELYNQLFSESHTNFLAHLGGLAGGALVALIAKRFLSKNSTDYLNEEVNKEKYQQAFNLGQQQLAAMNFKAAKETFEKLNAENPNDTGIKQQLFNIAKLKPDSEDFHQLAQQLMKLSGADRPTVRIVHDVFIEYSNRARPKPQLSPELLVTLAMRFAANDYLADAEKIMNYLLHAKSDFSRNPEGLSALAKYFTGKDQQKASHYRQLLLQTYPDSIQARHLKRVST